MAKPEEAVAVDVAEVVGEAGLFGLVLNIEWVGPGGGNAFGSVGGEVCC